jgi:hypothetical protein
MFHLFSSRKAKMSEPTAEYCEKSRELTATRAK